MNMMLKVSTGLLAFAVLLSPRIAFAHHHHDHGHHHGDDGDDGLHRTYFQYRYTSDASVPPIPPDSEFCSRAPFSATLYVQGNLTRYALANTRVVEGHHPRAVGFARACVEITDLTFTPFAVPVKIFWEVTVDDLGTFEAIGRCFPSSNDIPVPGIILGGCVMRFTKMPEGIAGGNMVESGVLLNAFGLPGFELSSSLVTFHLFSGNRL
ncbi:MAG TPA: hypothetical protein VFG83_12860 [Kofleriaceae bacterium]|nr:hypothetical protein [Kofleriaceae bacterium]